MMLRLAFIANIWPIWPANRLAKDFFAHFIEKRILKKFSRHVKFQAMSVLANVSLLKAVTISQKKNPVWSHED